jgi:hypothetical protein
MMTRLLITASAFSILNGGRSLCTFEEPLYFYSLANPALKGWDFARYACSLRGQAFPGMLGAQPLPFDNHLQGEVPWEAPEYPHHPPVEKERFAGSLETPVWPGFFGQHYPIVAGQLPRNGSTVERSLKKNGDLVPCLSNTFPKNLLDLPGPMDILVAPLHYTVRRCLPLALRRLSTFCPPLVSIRFRNPWVRFLLRLLGWR